MRKVLAALLVSILAFSLTNVAGSVEIERYSKAKFESAVQSGKPVVVNSWASWCPVCARQWPILEKVTKDDEFKDFAAFWIDFDKDKDALRDLKIPSQSNIKVYKGGTEVGWEIGVTSPEGIKKLLRTAK